jgi:hypothetical protein
MSEKPSTSGPSQPSSDGRRIPRQRRTFAAFSCIRRRPACVRRASTTSSGLKTAGILRGWLSAALCLGPGAASRRRNTSSGREHAWQLARLVDEHEMACRLRPVERHLEEEPERRHGRVDGWWAHAGRGINDLSHCERDPSEHRDRHFSHPIRAAILQGKATRHGSSGAEEFPGRRPRHGLQAESGRQLRH